MDDIFFQPVEGHGLKGLLSRLWYAVKRRFTHPEALCGTVPDASGLEFVVLAAGKSTRNYPHAKGLPHKSLAPFGSRKVIDEIMRQILSAGGRHITIVVSDESVIRSFEAAFRREPEIEKKFEKKGDTARLELLKSLYIPDGVEIKYLIQREPRGTGHATALAYEAIRDTGRGVVMIWPDDVFLADRHAKYPEDRAPVYRRAVARYIADGGRGNMAITMRVKDPSRWGIVEKDGHYMEKPANSKSDQAAKGFVIFDRAVCEELLAEARALDAGKDVPGLVGGELTFIPALNRVIDRDPKMRLRTECKRESDVYLDCGTTEGYEKALLYTLLTESRFFYDNFKFVRKLVPRIENTLKKEAEID